jgi:ribosomal protein S18 acetylase RimI-like enzyme
VIAAASQPAQSTAHIRRLDLAHDLPGLADLLEVAFAPDLAQTGNAIVSEFRQLAQAGPFLSLLTLLAPQAPILGIIWEEAGRIIGNVSLNRESKRHSLWTISNVAVHPDYRGRGIARQLMDTAIAEAGRRSARTLFLEARTDNGTAKRLYERCGFVGADTVHEMSRDFGIPVPVAMSGSLHLRRRRDSDAEPLFRLAQAATVPAVQQYRPPSPGEYHLSLLHPLVRFLDPILSLSQRSDWVIENSEVYGMMRVTGQYDTARHQIGIAVHPDHRGTIERELLIAGLRRLQRFPSRTIAASASTSHPEAIDAYSGLGFATVRVLEQMYLSLMTSGVNHRG